MILVGEMRDIETIGTAITAAETGHLVFATLHTQDTPQTIDRIIDVFPSEQQGQMRAMLSVALQGIMTQMLLPTADGAGRCVAAEVLVPTPAVRNLIREAKTHQIYSVLQTGASHGMQTMDSALAQLVRAGKVNRQLAESRAHAAEEFRRLIAGGGAADTRWRHKPWPLTSSRRWTSPAFRPRARSRPTPSRRSPSSSRSAAWSSSTSPQVPLQGDQPGAVLAGERQGPGGGLAPARHDGHLGHVDHARAPGAGDPDRSKMLKEAVAGVRHDVEAGLLLSDAMGRHPRVFGPLYVAMVRAGETGGVLEECLMRVADQLEKDAALRRQVRAAMIYPAIVITFAVTVLLALVAFLIPVFVGVFKQFPGKLPALTQFMVNFSHLVTHQWYLLIACSSPPSAASSR